MLCVKTYLAPSKIQGIGLFADEDIKKGEITWKYTEGFDSSFGIDEVAKMPPHLQIFIKRYSGLSMITNKYILGNDDVRFTNHSSNPNLESVIIAGETEKVARAKRDVKRGEEMTIDYRTFDKNDATSNKEYLK
jgi:SET domain-containing protein